MARYSLSSFVDLWERHEQLYLEVFSVALVRLSEQEPSLGHEDAISEELCVIINEVCFDIGQTRKNIEVRTPVWEGPIQPVNSAEMKGGKIRKRPDFTCKCANRFASSADEHEIPFHVECKRLGEPSSNSWNLNKKYVVNGIRRFDSVSHEYGKRAPSGLMIGYIIGMTPENILSEVISCQWNKLTDNPIIDFNFGTGKHFLSRQHLQRTYVFPKQFDLIHIWVDLRRS